MLTTIDVTATLKAKLGVDVAPRVILGACNPKLAHEAMQKEPEVSLFLPCNVVVTENTQEGTCDVMIIDPQGMMGILGNPALESLGKDAGEKLFRDAETLAKL